MFGLFDSYDIDPSLNPGYNDEVDYSGFADEPQPPVVPYRPHTEIIRCGSNPNHPVRTVTVTHPGDEFHCDAPVPVDKPANTDDGFDLLAIMATKYRSCGTRMSAGGHLVQMPYSEVCMHMRVAGKPMIVVAVGERSAQLYEPHTGKPFSAPITRGEAGLNRHGFPI